MHEKALFLIYSLNSVVISSSRNMQRECNVKINLHKGRRGAAELRLIVYATVVDSITTRMYELVINFVASLLF